MKALLMSLTFALALGTQVKADEPGTITDKQYECIADSLQAYNSDIFYGLTKEEVNELLTNPEAYGHYDALRMLKRCGVLGVKGIQK